MVKNFSVFFSVQIFQVFSIAHKKISLLHSQKHTHIYKHTQKKYNGKTHAIKYFFGININISLYIFKQIIFKLLKTLIGDFV